MIPPPTKQADPILDLFSQNSTNYENNNNRSTFYYQAPPKFVPSRPPPPIPTTAPVLNNDIKCQLTLKNLSLNPNCNTSETLSDLVDLGDPGSPPPSPKFDPFG